MSGVSQFTEVSGLPTHAWVIGEGPPLVIVPGLGCASWMYVRVAWQLAATRRVYVYDPPGHGFSEGRWNYPLTISDLTDHLAGWLVANRLAGAPLLGHSLGGEVILDLAARYPELPSALIACAPTGIPENPSVPEQFLRLLADIPLERPALWPLGFRAYSTAGVRRMALLAHNQTRHHTGPLLARVQVPTLLLDGTQDPVIHAWTVNDIQRGIPAAVVRQIRGGTHALTDSHPKAVARYTLDFLHLTESKAANWQNELPKDLPAQ